MNNEQGHLITVDYGRGRIIFVSLSFSSPLFVRHSIWGYAPPPPPPRHLPLTVPLDSYAKYWMAIQCLIRILLRLLHPLLEDIQVLHEFTTFFSFIHDQRDSLIS